MFLDTKLTLSNNRQKRTNALKLFCSPNKKLRPHSLKLHTYFKEENLKLGFFAL